MRRCAHVALFFAANFCPVIGTLTKQPSFLPSASPTLPAVRLRSSCELLLTWCASPESKPLFSLSPLLAAIHSDPLPILPVAPAPSCAVKLPILLASVGFSRMFPTHSATQSLKSQYLASLHVTALACARHEAPEAHYLGFPLFPPQD
jgi:hypothetical protein